MTWPNSAINTTNLDAGTDQPALARADLKSAVDAVNAMIAYGDPKANIPFFEVQATNTRDGSNRIQLAVTTNPMSLVTLSDNNYRFTVPAGTYYCAVTRPVLGTSAQGPDLYDVTNDITTTYTDYSSVASIFSGGGAAFLTLNNSMLILSVDTTFEWRKTSAVSAAFRVGFLRVST